MTGSIARLPLNSGTKIPQLGFGVFLVDPADTQRVVEDGLEVGYRHIDTATGYGNEAEVGRGIAASGLPREEVFVTTKLHNPDQKSGNVADAFERSLERLGTDYVDLYLIHWPLPAIDKYVETWRVLEGFAAEGRARAIGVCNFNVDHLERLTAETDLVPAVNQVELHPAFSQPDLRSYNAQHDILTEAWGPLGQGKYDLFSLAPIQDAAAAHDITPAQAVLAWHLAIGNIVIPKSTHKERLAENLAAAEVELTEDEVAAISALNEDKRVGPDPADFNRA